MRGRYFDFTPVEPWAGGYGSIFSGIGEALQSANIPEYRAAQRRLDIADRRQAAAQAFEEAQAAQAARTAQSREQRETLEFNQRQARQRGTDVRDIAKALGGGRFGEAQALGAASQFVNPKTGQLEGIGVQQKPLGPAPTAPVAPIEPAPPEFVGPLETPDMARTRAMGAAFGATEPPPFDAAASARADAAAQAVTDEQAKRDKFAAAQEQFPAAQAQYETEKADYGKAQSAYDQEKAHPNYTLTFPGGQTQDITSDEQKRAAQQEARDQAMRLRTAASQPGQAPDVARAMMLQADLIETQLANADKAPVTNMNAAVQAQGFKGGQADKDRALKRELKTKAMGRGLGGGANAGLAELIRMKEQGANDSDIAARAAQLHIPAGGKNGWLQNTKEVVRGGYVKFREGERMAGLQATDANGQVLGTWKTPADGARMNKQTAQFDQLRVRLTDLINDIDQTGDRVLTPAEQQRRNSLFDLAAAAGRVYNGLGATDASQKLEQEILSARGTLGHGWLIGANKEIVKHLLDEATQQHNVRVSLALRKDNAQGGGQEAAPSSAAAVGATKQGPDGRTYRKVGPNNWQPVTQ